MASISSDIISLLKISIRLYCSFLKMFFLHVVFVHICPCQHADVWNQSSPPTLVSEIKLGSSGLVTLPTEPSL